MNDLGELRQIYLGECVELMQQLEDSVATIADLGDDAEAVNAAFRAVHSIKGGAGAFGYERLQRFAHSFESVLGRAREHEILLDEALTSLLQRAADHVADLLGDARGELTADDAREGILAAELLAYLSHESGGDGAGESAPEDLDDMVARLLGEAGLDDEIISDDDVGEEESGEVADQSADQPSAERTVGITFIPGPDLLRNGNDPRLIFRALDPLGDLTIEADVSGLEDIDNLDPAVCAVTWSLALRGSASKSDIEDVFAFVGEDAALLIDDPWDQEPPAAVAPVAPSPPRTVPTVAAPAPPPQPTAATAPQPTPAAPPAKPAEPAPTKATQPAAMTLRVDMDRVDRLVNMVGEIAITQSVLAQEAGRLGADGHEALTRAVEELTQQTRVLQEAVMAIRTQPVRAVFQKLPRLVRDLADKTGKRLKLVTRGEETEIDKTVIERLSDPLTHLIRNAADHGLEGPDERMAAGKNPEGVITLSAGQRSGRILIEIGDDGRGIPHEKILKKAVEKGLVPANAQLSPDEIVNLIFLPGFSTAEQVSDISGRGVGMDVVRQNITDIGGRITVRTELGRGTNFTLALPLTLAVMEGIACRAGTQTFVLPIVSVIESIRLTPQATHQLTGIGDTILLRGQTLKLIRLRTLFGLNGEPPDRETVVVVEADEGRHFGLVVDELLGQYQVVVKSLERHYRRVAGVAAATILGDGRVAMILDIPGIAELERHRWMEGRRTQRAGGM